MFGGTTLGAQQRRKRIRELRLVAREGQLVDEREVIRSVELLAELLLEEWEKRKGREHDKSGD